MNNKSILIIPTPRDCEHCDLPFTIDEILGRVVCWEDEYGKHCPLKPLPQELDNISALPEDPNNWSFVHYESLGYEEGWNACLEEIMGETE